VKTWPAYSIKRFGTRSSARTGLAAASLNTEHFKVKTLRSAFTLIEAARRKSRSLASWPLCCSPAFRAPKPHAKEAICVNNLKADRGSASNCTRTTMTAAFPPGAERQGVRTGYCPRPGAIPVYAVHFISVRHWAGMVIRLKPGMANSRAGQRGSTASRLCEIPRPFSLSGGCRIRRIHTQWPKNQTDSLGHLPVCSYQYNGQTELLTLKNMCVGWPGKKEQWVGKSPSQFVLMHESAAQPWDPGQRPIEFCIYWHRGAQSRGRHGERPDGERRTARLANPVCRWFMSDGWIAPTPTAASRDIRTCNFGFNLHRSKR